jgi:acyl transferase domain-containing protein
MALAGGVSLIVSRKKEASSYSGGVGIISPPTDIARAFDADALGTVSGEGIGISPC